MWHSHWPGMRCGHGRPQQSDACIVHVHLNGPTKKANLLSVKTTLFLPHFSSIYLHGNIREHLWWICKMFIHRHLTKTKDGNIPKE